MRRPSWSGATSRRSAAPCGSGWPTPGWGACSTRWTSASRSWAASSSAPPRASTTWRRPRQVLGLLAAMARNKLAIAGAAAAGPAAGTAAASPPATRTRIELVDPGHGPSREVAARDLLQEVRRRLVARRAAAPGAEERGARLGRDRRASSAAARRPCARSWPGPSTGSPSNWAWTTSHDRTDRRPDAPRRPGRRRRARPAAAGPAAQAPAPRLAAGRAAPRWRPTSRQQPELRADPEAVLDLIYNEIVLREEAGESPRLEEYLRRFPDAGPPARAPVRAGGGPRAEDPGPGPGRARPCRPTARARRLAGACRPSPATRSSGSWAAAAWASSTRPARSGSTASSP